MSVVLSGFNLEELRSGLRAMTDTELIRFGKAGRYLTDPKQNRCEPPREVFVIQLQEAREEWKRRHPKCAGISLTEAVNARGQRN